MTPVQRKAKQSAAPLPERPQESAFAQEEEEENEFEEARCDAGWAAREFEGADLGDTRLTARLAKMAEAFGANPQGSIPQVQADASATKAAYRFLSNPKVNHKNLLGAHFQRTGERMKGEPIVLCAHDTTTLNFEKNKNCEGLGYIGSGQVKGMDLHSALALTPQGLPLGLLAQQAITHAAPKRRAKRRERNRLPIEEKESFRWIQGLRDMARIASGASFEGQLVAICDREADIYEMLVEAGNLNVHYVIRLARPRQLEAKAPDGSALYIPEQIEKLEPSGTLTVSIPARSGAPARQALVAIRFGQVKVKPPERRGRSRRSAILIQETFLQLYVVCAQEINAPEGVDPINWVLLTDVPVESHEDAVERVEWYKTRWQIEVYHKVFKSGCKIEERMLEKFSALCSCAAAAQRHRVAHLLADSNRPSQAASSRRRDFNGLGVGRFNALRQQKEEKNKRSFAHPRGWPSDSGNREDGRVSGAQA